MKLLGIFVVLGLSPLAAAAPVPLIVSDLATQVRHSVQKVILRVPSSPTPLTVDATNAYEEAPVIIDNRPITPSATIAPEIALEAPAPLHTTYLLALARHPRPQRKEKGPEEGDEAHEVPDTVSPTSYARIEAGLVELYPVKLGMPCWQRGADARRQFSRYQHDLVVIGLVCAFLAVLFVTEAAAAVRQRYVCRRGP
jgi:hypothetical protein